MRMDGVVDACPGAEGPVLCNNGEEISKTARMTIDHPCAPIRGGCRSPPRRGVTRSQGARETGARGGQPTHSLCIHSRKA